MEHVRPDKQVVDPHQPVLTAVAHRTAEAADPRDVAGAANDANIVRQARLMRDEWRRSRYSRLKPT